MWDHPMRLVVVEGGAGTGQVAAGDGRVGVQDGLRAWSRAVDWQVVLVSERLLTAS